MMLDENHSPDHLVFSYPVPDGPGTVGLNWSGLGNVMWQTYWENGSLWMLQDVMVFADVASVL